MDKVKKLLLSENEGDFYIAVDILKNKYSLLEIEELIKNIGIRQGYEALYNGFPQYLVKCYCAKEEGCFIQTCYIFYKEGYIVFFDLYVLGICEINSEYRKFKVI